MSAAESGALPPPASPPSAFAPLRQKLFAILWIATVLGNVGSFMRDVASAWLVTDLSSSPLAVSAIQAAGTLPVLLLAIPAGVLSDILDRRHLLIGILLALAAVSGSLSILAASGHVSVVSLVALTFAGGIGAALAAPSWQAIVPELVSRGDLKAAVALNSLGFNIARAIGPAIGGLLVAVVGAATTYLFDVVSDLVVVAALLWWKRKAASDDVLREHFGGALRAGLRYARASRPLHQVLLQAFLFFALASAVWALLPIVARRELGGGPGLYGLLLGCVGAGAIAGAIVLPRLKARLGQDGLIVAAMLLAAGTIAAVAVAGQVWVAVAAAGLLGIAWIAVLATLNGIVQAILPNWVRGRGLSIYLTVQGGGLAAGSLGWGLVADGIGTSAALLVSAAGLALMAVIKAVLRIRLPEGEDDLDPALHWAEPDVATAPGGDRGPVIITIAYRVGEPDRPAFLTALHRLSDARRRDGAYAWGVAEDAADPALLVEWFFVESWAEHLRQHRRVSKTDADVQAELRRFHVGEAPPAVTHLIGIDPRRPPMPP
ncbi:MFS transporter [Enterovirga rhinocerotis]|uniref:Putative MFS family arabinose efflux permease n=1 Tax=Enterovirga rhinocerotis TaxID=1339210 RepID=A0A4R7BLU4_9HYPH|nr:MFS transporter [Enterovirga rhinocerotis]TDR85235.1 putative MFS family arabinose efflux permease [Enterovirga rhinocerotis]